MEAAPTPHVETGETGEIAVTDSAETGVGIADTADGDGAVEAAGIARAAALEVIVDGPATEPGARPARATLLRDSKAAVNRASTSPSF